MESREIIAILAQAESMPRHEEEALIRIERRYRVAFRKCQQLREDGTTVIVELARERRPIEAGNPVLRRHRRGHKLRGLGRLCDHGPVFPNA
jgi:hypothetical protein